MKPIKKLDRDPIYYNPLVIIQKINTLVERVNELENHDCDYTEDSGRELSKPVCPNGYSEEECCCNKEIFPGTMDALRKVTIKPVVSKTESGDERCECLCHIDVGSGRYNKHSEGIICGCMTECPKPSHQEQVDKLIEMYGNRLWNLPRNTTHQNYDAVMRSFATDLEKLTNPVEE